jgi:hypothetical protein
MREEERGRGVRQDEQRHSWKLSFVICEEGRGSFEQEKVVGLQQLSVSVVPSVWQAAACSLRLLSTA